MNLESSRKEASKRNVLRNHWYLAAWSDEVSEAPLGRTVLSEGVVLFRTSDGPAHALQDRCAHRRMPLSNGKLVGDTLICCYHGLAYAASGECVRIPGQAKVPAGVQRDYGTSWTYLNPDIEKCPR